MLAGWRRVAIHSMNMARDCGIMGAADKDGLQWCEDTAAIGLRFVGFADELAPRYAAHTGWYTCEDGFNESNLRGAVWQLPARNGRAQYVAGYRTGSETLRTWADDIEGAARLDLRNIIAGEAGGATDKQAPEFQEAAIAADNIARIAAEHEMEYNEAWCAAMRWQDLEETAATERTAARQLIRDIRAARLTGIAAAESICSTLRRAVRSHLQAMADARAERETISGEFWYRDSKGKAWNVAEFAAANV